MNRTKRSEAAGRMTKALVSRLSRAQRESPRAFAGATAGAALLVAVLLYFGFRDRPATRAECTEMLEHYIDMTIAADPELAKLPPDRQAPAREMKRAIRAGDTSFARVEEQCEQEISRREHACAMKAKAPNDWEACID